MAREWQQTKYAEYVLPDAVYYQVLWAVRDLERLEKELEELKDTRGDVNGNPMAVGENHHSYMVSSKTENKAIRILLLDRRINQIEDAFDIVPEKYKGYVINSIINKVAPKKGFPDNIWKIWKQRFLYQVAKNFELV